MSHLPSPDANPNSSYSELQNLFQPDKKYTFLVGAGVSMNHPSNIPSAISFVNEILTLCAPEEERSKIIGLEHLRYELLIEKFKIYFDPNLHFLDYLELVQTPNLLHYFLATAIIEQNFVVTTNFDFLIENALKTITPPDERQKITPIITREDFTKYTQPYELSSQQRYGVYKIHGSKKNIITGQDTSDSLITTVGSLGKDRLTGETFTLERYKQQPFYNLVQGRNLIVIGYSGNDDFDIGPMLEKTPWVESIVWIEHRSGDDIEIKEIKADSKAGEPLESKPAKSTVLLQKIANKKAIPIFQIFANTQNFLCEKVWPLIFPDFPLYDSSFVQNPEPQEFNPVQRPPFKSWIRNEFSHVKKTEAEKWLFACSIYRDFKQWKELERAALTGLNLLKSAASIDSSKSKTEIDAANEIRLKLINDVCVSRFYQRKYFQSLEILQEGITFAQNTGKFEFLAPLLNNMGVVSNSLRYIMPKSQLAETEQMFHDSLKLNEEHRNVWGKIVAVNNLAAVDFWKGAYKKTFRSLMETYTEIQHLGNLSYKVAILMNFGMMSEFFMSKKDVEKNYQEAISISRLTGNYSDMVLCHLRLSRYWMNHNNPTEAKKVLNEAERLIEIHQLSQLLPDFHIISAWLEFNEGNNQKALTKMKSALSLLQTSVKPDQGDNLRYIWQLQYQMDLAYFNYQSNEITKSTEIWEECQQLVENLALESPYIAAIRSQIKSNLRISRLVKNKSELSPNLALSLKLLSHYSFPDLPIEERLKRVEEVIQKGIRFQVNPQGELEEISDIEKYAHLQFDRVYLQIAQGNLNQAGKFAEQVVEFCSRLELYSILTKQIEQLSSLAVVVKPVQSYRFPYYFLTQAEQDSSQADQEWLASWRSRDEAKEVFQIVKRGHDSFQSGNYGEALELFERAQEMFNSLGEKEQVEELESTIDTVRTLKMVEETDIKKLMAENPTQAQKLLAKAQLILQGKNEVEKPPSSDNISLEGIINRDLLVSLRFLSELEERGRTQDLLHDHSDEFYRALSKINVALDLSDKMNRTYPLKKINLLTTTALMLINEKEYLMAKERLDEAYHTTIAYGNEAGEEQAKVLQHYCYLYYGQKNYRLAIHYGEQSMRIFEERENNNEFWGVLGIVGFSYKLLGELERALHYYNRCLFVEITAENAKAIMESCYHAASIEFDKGECQSAINFISQSIQIYEHFQPESHILGAMFLMAGQTYNYTTNNEKMIKYYLKAAEIYEKSPQKEIAAKLKKNIETFRSKSQNPLEKLQNYFENAEKAMNSEEVPLETTLKLFNFAYYYAFQIGDNQYQFKCAYNLGILYYIWHIPHKFLQYFKITMELYGKIVPNPENLDIYNYAEDSIKLISPPKKIPYFYRDSAQELIKYKDFEGSLRLHQRIFQIFALNHQKDEMIYTLVQIGDLYLYSLEKPQSASVAYNQAESLFNEGEICEERVNIWRKQCDTYNKLENYHKAIIFAQKVIEYYENAKNQEIMHTMYNFLGECYSNLQDLAHAVMFYEQALQISRTQDYQDNPSIPLYDYFSTAYSHHRLGNFARALEIYREGQNKAQTLQSSIFQQVFYINTSEILFIQGKLQVGLNNAEIAVKLHETTKRGDYTAEAYFVLGQILLSMTDFTQSKISLQQAQKLYESIPDGNGAQICAVLIKWAENKLGNCSKPELFSMIEDKETQNFEENEKKALLYKYLGEIYSSEGEFAAAKKMYEVALEICKSLNLLYYQARIWFEGGKVLRKLGDIEEGNSWLLKAKEAYSSDNIDNPEIYSEINQILAKVQ